MKRKRSNKKDIIKTSKIKTNFASFIKWYKENSSAKKEEKEFEEFLLKIEKRMDKVGVAKKAKTIEAKAEIALMFENAYTQRKMIEVNNSLKSAIWVLCVAIVAFTIGSVYGVSQLNKVSFFVLQIVTFFLAIGLSIWILRGIWDFITWIWKQ